MLSAFVGTIDKDEPGRKSRRHAGSQSLFSAAYIAIPNGLVPCNSSGVYSVATDRYPYRLHKLQAGQKYLSSGGESNRPLDRLKSGGASMHGAILIEAAKLHKQKSDQPDWSHAIVAHRPTIIACFASCLPYPAACEVGIAPYIITCED